MSEHNDVVHNGENGSRTGTHQFRDFSRLREEMNTWFRKRGESERLREREKVLFRGRLNSKVGSTTVGRNGQERSTEKVAEYTQKTTLRREK